MKYLPGEPLDIAVTWRANQLGDTICDLENKREP